MRIRKDRKIKEKIDNIKDEYLVSNPENNKGNWKKIFNNGEILNLEIGYGKGQFITSMSEKNQDQNFCGIELVEEVVYQALKKITNSKENLKNIKIIHSNGKDVSEYFEKDEIDNIYLNFSDPWPKSRHEKRRLTSKDFLTQYKKVLKRGGKLTFKTDNRDLFEFSLNSLLLDGWEVRNVKLNYIYEDVNWDAKTEYETKFTQEGKNIFRLEAKLLNN